MWWGTGGNSASHSNKLNSTNLFRLPKVAAPAVEAEAAVETAVEAAVEAAPTPAVTKSAPPAVRSTAAAPTKEEIATKLGVRVDQIVCPI